MDEDAHRPAVPKKADSEAEDDVLAGWSPKAAVEQLHLEGSVYDGETNQETAQRLTIEAAPQAALSIIHLSVNARNEQVRLRAAQYILDRTLGRIGDVDDPTKQDELEILVGKLQSLGAEPASDLVKGTSSNAGN